MKSYLDYIKYIEIWNYLFYKSIRDREDENLTNYYLFSFAVTCYHLKDWLINDKNFSKKEVESHIKSNIRLKNLGTIANSFKHFKLSGRYWKDIQVLKKQGNKFSFKSPLPVFIIKDKNSSKSSNVTVHTPHKSLYSWDKLFKNKRMKLPFRKYY